MSLKCILQGQDSKNLATKEELKKYLPLTGGELTGDLNGKYITGTWLQTSSVTDLGDKSTKIAVLNKDGWIYYRTPTEILSDIGAASSSHNHNSQYYKKEEVSTTPKPNLFINPLFQIWQLYPSGWSGVPVNRYVCDGWRVLSSDGNKQNNLRPASPYGMTSAAGGANCTISQFLENAEQFNGLQMTCSVLKIDASGTQSFVTSTKMASDWTDSTDILAFFGTSSAWRQIGPGETLIGAKLEVGTRQTFVYKQADGTYTLNNIPPVAEQLAICNKYDPKTGKLLGGWDHPPMQLGVEYRTTERYLGKPVYATLVNCGIGPAANTTKTISHGLNSVGCIVSCYGVLTVNNAQALTLPYYKSANNHGYCQVSYSNVEITAVGTPLTAYNNCYALIKYTKSTD